MSKLKREIQEQHKTTNIKEALDEKEIERIKQFFIKAKKELENIGCKKIYGQLFPNGSRPFFAVRGSRQEPIDVYNKRVAEAIKRKEIRDSYDEATIKSTIAFLKKQGYDIKKKAKVK